MTNVEFYKKWGNSEVLKILVNVLILNIVDGYVDEYVTNWDDFEWLCRHYGITRVSQDMYLQICECLQDLRHLPYGVVKNVFKKVL